MSQHSAPYSSRRVVRSIFLIDTELAFTIPERVLCGAHFNGGCLMALACIGGVTK